VIPSSVNIPKTALGIVRRFVVNYVVKLEISGMVIKMGLKPYWAEAKLPECES
jgi:hypothetical protein